MVAGESSTVHVAVSPLAAVDGARGPDVLADAILLPKLRADPVTVCELVGNVPRDASSRVDVPGAHSGLHHTLHLSPLHTSAPSSVHHIRCHPPTRICLCRPAVQAKHSMRITDCLTLAEKLHTDAVHMQVVMVSAAVSSG